MIYDDFDMDEKASAYFHEGETPEPDCECWFRGDIADASECPLHGLDAADWRPEPVTCPVLIRVIVLARTVGELADAMKAHKLEFCEDCGQMEGFIRPDRSKAA